MSKESKEKVDVKNECKETTSVETLPWYTNEEKSVFAKIDREQEDKDVDMFQKTNDIRLFEKVYKARIPTLQIWARKHSYLSDSKDDMFSEFCLCFTKAVFSYKKKHGAFNTWLFRLLINCYQNLQIGRRAKKRLPEGMEPNAMSKNILSLDYSYDGKDGSENTLKDVLAGKILFEDTSVDKIVINETVSMMSNGNPVIKGFLKKLSDGNTVASLLKECKTKRGNIHITNAQIDNLHGKRNQKNIVSELIKNNTPIRDDFIVLDYKITKDNNLHYVIEMKKTEETDLMMKTIRRLRKDKKNILNRMYV